MEKRSNTLPGVTFRSYVMQQEHGHSVLSLGQEYITDLQKNSQNAKNKRRNLKNEYVYKHTSLYHKEK